MTNNELINATETKKEEPKTENTNAPFDGVPMESLIAAPIIAAAQGQQELTAVYLDNLMKLAYTTEESTNQAHAEQKQPSEGMTKLTSLLAQTMEPTSGEES